MPKDWFHVLVPELIPLSPVFKSISILITNAILNPSFSPFLATGGLFCSIAVWHFGYKLVWHDIRWCFEYQKRPTWFSITSVWYIIPRLLAADDAKADRTTVRATSCAKKLYTNYSLTQAMIQGLSCKFIQFNTVVTVHVRAFSRIARQLVPYRDTRTTVITTCVGMHMTYTMRAKLAETASVTAGCTIYQYCTDEQSTQGPSTRRWSIKALYVSSSAPGVSTKPFILGMASTLCFGSKARLANLKSSTYSQIFRSRRGLRGVANGISNADIRGTVAHDPAPSNRLPLLPKHPVYQVFDRTCLARTSFFACFRS